MTWEEAIEFCHRLSERTGKVYTLPSEVQWEYACRATTTTPFAFGETLISEIANYNGKYAYDAGPKGTHRSQTTDVMSFPANTFGLYDMHGNVWEWCLDQWNGSYTAGPFDGDAWIADGTGLRPARGGSWNSHPTFCRSAYRYSVHLDNCGSVLGFRVCCWDNPNASTLT